MNKRRHIMIILGVNGWTERSHDASACLIVDNKIVAFAEEERFIRQKHSFDKLPHQSVAYCLNQAEISPDDIDVIAWGWDFPLIYKLHGRKFAYDLKKLNEMIFPKKYYPQKTKTITVEFVNHYLAHAASVYCCRTEDTPMAVAVIDGSGENASACIFKGESGFLKRIWSSPTHSSLGFFYEAACQYLGFNRWQAGKLMGLASYGKAMGDIFFKISDCEMSPLFDFESRKNNELDWEEEIISRWLKIFEKNWGITMSPRYTFNRLEGRIESSLIFGTREKNIAATIQFELERVYEWHVKKALESTNGHEIALAGGVALNCSANGIVKEKKLVNKIYIQPAVNDAGVSLGAAVTILGYIPKRFFLSPYLGPGFSNDEIYKCLMNVGVSFIEPANINFEIAKALDRGKIVGYFNGRMEVGPRALGARSILANPRKKENHTRVNAIKSRESWRPLAPSILEEKKDVYFTLSDESPYMLFRSFVKKEKKTSIPAVIHVDDSARPQTVNIDLNPCFYDLICQFNHLTGVPIVLNTSFNNEREPIVCTPMDALRTFYEIGLSELAMGPFLIKKRGG